jgi:hypothetical protein
MSGESSCMIAVWFLDEEEDGPRLLATRGWAVVADFLGQPAL